MGVKDDDGKDISFSVRVPTRTVVLAFLAVVTGGLGVGATVYQKAENSTTTACYASAERAENLAERAVNLATDAITRDSARAAELERLRIALQQGTDDRYTKSEADRINENNRREHDVLKQADASHDRQINQLDRDVEELKGLRR